MAAATAALRRHRRGLRVCARRVRDLSRTVSVFATADKDVRKDTDYQVTQF